MRFCRNARGLLPFLAVLSFSCVFRGTLTQSAMSARLICALGPHLFCARGLHGLRGLCCSLGGLCCSLGGMCGGLHGMCVGILFCARGLRGLWARFARVARSVLQFGRYVRRFARYVRRYLVLRARFYAVCATICAGCAVCARGPCALRVYFKVSNNSTARFVVTVSAPPLSGSASPALSTSSPKGSPPAVRSSFI